MFFFTAILRFVLVLTVLFYVVSPVFDLAAQEIDDDPLMLDGGDEFGFGQFGDNDFQSGDFGSGGF